ncbi:MAG: hypothetical protein KIT09_30405 [Bryobacteraceae bacterium]|nr:hypothetical protein [Bryobacteraceae bacterium]
MYTDQQLQALRDALANGVRRVRFADREIEYRTIDELKAAIAAAEADLAGSGGGTAIRQIRVYTEKGF